MLYFHMWKKPIQPIRMAYSCFHMWTYNQSTIAKGLCSPIRIVHRLHSNSVSDFGGFFYQRLLQIFLRRRRKTLDLCQLVAAQTCLYGIKKTRTHRANHREMSHCSKKFSFKERAERDSKYWCKRCQRVYRQFSAPSAWVFVFTLRLENYFN